MLIRLLIIVDELCSANNTSTFVGGRDGTVLFYYFGKCDLGDFQFVLCIITVFQLLFILSLTDSLKSSLSIPFALYILLHPLYIYFYLFTYFLFIEKSKADINESGVRCCSEWCCCIREGGWYREVIPTALRVPVSHRSDTAEITGWSSNTSSNVIKDLQSTMVRGQYKTLFRTDGNFHEMGRCGKNTEKHHSL